MQENTRIGYLDAAKGIGVICVMAGHVFSRHYGFGQYIYSFHMPLFFIISGMLLHFRETSELNMCAAQFVKRKAASYLYPYLIFGILSLVILFFVEGWKSTAKYFVRFLYGDGYATLWYLPAVFLAELVVFFVLKKKKAGVIFGFMITAVIVSVLFSKISYQSFTGFRFEVLNVMCVAIRAWIGSFFILSGYLARKWFVKKRRVDTKDKEKIVFVILGTVTFAVNIVLFRYNYVDLHYCEIGNPLLFYLNAFLGSASILLAAYLIFDKNRMLSFFGTNSLIIFIVHRNFLYTVLSKKIIEALIGNILPISDIMSFGEYVYFLSSFVLLVVMTVVTTLVIKRYLPFLYKYEIWKSGK